MSDIEKFKDVRGKHGLSEKYFEIAHLIWEDLKRHFPKTYGSLEKCLSQTENINSLMYDVIYGSVQSGKSRAIMLICWYCKYITIDILPVILTIKLSSVRDDFIGKASHHGEINIAIQESIKRNFSKNCVELNNYFMLKAVDLIQHRQKRSNNGEIVVLLQEPNNLRELAKFYNEYCQSGSGKKLLVIIDEIHKMFTVPMKNREDGLNEKELDGFKNQKMMYWLHKKFANHRIYLLGVTATAARTLVDSHIYPTTVHCLESDVVKNSIYYGKIYDKSPNKFRRNKTQLCNDGWIQWRSSNGDLIETIRKIVDRRSNEINGTTIIKTVLITVERTKAGHYSILKELEDDIYLKDKFCSIIVNDDQDNLQDQFDILKQKISHKKSVRRCLVNGVLVIVGLGCFSAGVSVKPKPGTKIEFDYGDQQYQIFGITDQIYNIVTKTDTKYMETNVQAMRLFGYYPIGYDLTLWTNNSDERDILIDQLQHNDFISREYNGTPESLKLLTRQHKYKLFANDPYKCDQSRSYKILVTSQCPKNIDLVKPRVMLFPIGQWLSESGYDCTKTIADYKCDRPEQSILKRKITQLVEQHYWTDAVNDESSEKIVTGKIQMPRNYFQISYDELHQKEILKSAVHPRRRENQSTSISKDYKVNCFITGNQGCYTTLDEIYLVYFNDQLYKLGRKELDLDKSRTRLDYCDQNESTYCVKLTPDQFAIIYPQNSTTELYHHKYLACMDNDLNSEHRQEIRNISKVDFKPVRSPPAYTIFCRWYKEKYGTVSNVIYGQKWKLVVGQNREYFTECKRLGLTQFQLNKEITDKLDFILE